jgi:sulfoxide reductase heme-binding subunit YedZ
MVGLTLAQPLAHGAGMLRVYTPATPSPLLWYLTRALAVSSYVALTLSVILGMLRSIARTARESLSWLVDELHQVVATLSGLLVAGHLITLKLDPFLPFSVTNLLLPLDEPYRPLAVVLGVFALYAMALALVSSWLRRSMPYRFWRALHYVSFVAFALVTAHGWLAGSDAGEPWMYGFYVGASVTVGFLVLMRLTTRAPSASKQASGQIRVR